MNAIRLFLIPVFLVSISVSAQVSLTLATDKTTYSYGDTIEVQLTISNNTDSVFTMRGSTSCIVTIRFNAVPFSFVCTADDREFRFSPGGYMTWIWHLKPAVLGIPDKDGEQTIRGFGGGMVDSIKIQAPKYYGGQVSVSIPIGIPAAEIQSLRDSLNVTVLLSDTLDILGVIHEHWQVTGHTIDSVIQAYTGDHRLNYIVNNRIVSFDETIVASVPFAEVSPLDGFSLSHNYPNPFNPTTQIEFNLAEIQHVTLTVYDLMGRLVSTLVDRDYDPGPHSVRFDGSGLASGIYLYRLQTPKYD